MTSPTSVLASNPTATLTAAADLEQLAEWMREHRDDLPEFFSIHCYKGGAQVSFHVQGDAELDALIEFTVDDFRRYDHVYETGPWARISNGHIAERVELSVAVSR